MIPACTTPVPNGSCITAQALALLHYYPEPNVNIGDTDPTDYNYQTISNAGTNNVAINAVMCATSGRARARLSAASVAVAAVTEGAVGAGGNANTPPALRQNINLGYNYSILPAISGTSSSRSAARRPPTALAERGLHDQLRQAFQQCLGDLEPRSSETRNYFTDTTTDPSAAAGINVPNRARPPLRTAASTTACRP